MTKYFLSAYEFSFTFFLGVFQCLDFLRGEHRNYSTATKDTKQGKCDDKINSNKNNDEVNKNRYKNSDESVL